MYDFRKQMIQCFMGCVCLLGLGNREYGDDGFGLSLANILMERLQGCEQKPCGHLVINAGTMPERAIGSVRGKRFDHLIFLDAVEFGGMPGSVVLLPTSEISARFPQISTHKISLGLLAKLVEAEGITKAWLLGVQPELIRQGQGLTTTVQKTLLALTEMFTRLWILNQESCEDSQVSAEKMFT